MRRLNLGCGTVPREHAVNHSLLKHADYVDVAWDLNILPWPWADGEFDAVEASSVFEHLTIDLLTSMNEVWRILKPRGTASVKLPYWRNPQAYADPTHRYVFDPEVMDAFDPSTSRGAQYSFYTPFKWTILSRVFVNDEKTSFRTVLEKWA